MALIHDRSGEVWTSRVNGAPTLTTAVDWLYAQSELAQDIDRALARALDAAPDGCDDYAAVEAPYVAAHRALMRAPQGAPWQGAVGADTFELALS